MDHPLSNSVVEEPFFEDQFGEACNALFQHLKGSNSTPVGETCLSPSQIPSKFTSLVAACGFHLLEISSPSLAQQTV